SAKMALRSGPRTPFPTHASDFATRISGHDTARAHRAHAVPARPYPPTTNASRPPIRPEYHPTASLTALATRAAVPPMIPGARAPRGIGSRGCRSPEGATVARRTGGRAFGATVFARYVYEGLRSLRSLHPWLLTDAPSGRHRHGSRVRPAVSPPPASGREPVP